MTSSAVRLAAAREDLNHREPEYQELIREVRERLIGIYPQLTQGEFGFPQRKHNESLRKGAGVWVPYLLGGSGTAAVEAMITSCIKTGPVLLLEGGYYSARMREILEIHKIPHEVHKTDWKSPINLTSVESALEDRTYEAVLMTHDETTLGRLNDIDSVGELCNAHNVKLLVDAMSSFGADSINFTNIDAVAASANKCLHGLPGVGFVLVRDWLSDEMAGYEPKSYYLHLPLYRNESPPLTPPVPMLSAFRQALREAERGQPGRHQDYIRKANLIRSGLRQRGFEMALSDNEMSCTLSTATLPKGWSYDRWFKANYERGFVIYACKAQYREQFFQVSHMGEVSDHQLNNWLKVVDELL